MSSPEELVQERGKTHGDFTDHARITQCLKLAFMANATESSIAEMQFTHLEAIEMIFHKIGRIGAGNPNFADHWEDIAGYATLVAQRLRPSK